MVTPMLGGDKSMPAMMGTLVGTKEQVLIAQGITAPVSGLVDEAMTKRLYR